jgi:hypothetical protein
MIMEAHRKAIDGASAGVDTNYTTIDSSPREKFDLLTGDYRVATRTASAMCSLVCIAG